MNVIVSISEEDLTRIKKALTSKKYSSISEFVTLAIQNQLILEGDISKIPNLESLILQEQDKLPDIIEEKIEPKIIEPHKIETVPSNEVQDNFPFWGTQNKYFCLKQITIDFLKLASQEKFSWIRYDVAMNFLIKGAVEIRRRFEAIDKILHRPRGDKFQTGFPLNDSKSISRYEKQYIGSIDANNKIYGMALEMGFLSIRKNEETNKLEFGMTEFGQEFANIQSPIIYKKTSEISPSTPHLGEEEVEYILKILKDRKPSEIELIRFTLEYISQGKNQPDEGKQPTKEFFDRTYPDIARNKKEGSFSFVEANTMRAGIISRLSELGLIRILRKGIKSEYEVTERGYNFLKGGNN